MGVLDKLRAFRRPKQLELEDYLKKLDRKGLDKEGRLVPDPTPIAPPIGYKKQPSMVEIVREMVRSERLAAEARAMGHETFEESEDFDVGDEPEFARSQWENEYDPPLQEILAAGREALKARESSSREAGEDRRPKAAPPQPSREAAPAASVAPSNGLPDVKP